MKSDLDRLMAERGIDALLILPGENEDPYRTYLSNGVRGSGMVIKKQGAAPVLIVNPMEVDEARQSGIVDRFLAELEAGNVRPEVVGSEGQGN